MTKNIHILIIDDDPETLELISHSFIEAGIRNFKIFIDVYEFLANLDSAHIAIVDHNLGGISGFNIIENISQHNKNRKSVAKIQVIIFSGEYDVDVPAHYLNMKKARVYLNKNSKRYNYLEALVDWTKIVSEEVAEDIAYDQRLCDRENRLTALLNIAE